MSTSDAPPTERRPGDRPVRYVLLVCNHNAGRSQMAQAFFERYGPDAVRAESAGTDPAREVWPTVVQAMAELGIDIAARRPKKRTVEMQPHAIRERIAVRLEAIRSDRTAHQLRLTRLIPLLSKEFAAARSPELIRACADAVLDGFDGARVRSHIMTLAHRQTRECLRRETCDLIAAREGS